MAITINLFELAEKELIRERKPLSLKLICKYAYKIRKWIDKHPKLSKALFSKKGLNEKEQYRFNKLVKKKSCKHKKLIKVLIVLLLFTPFINNCYSLDVDQSIINYLWKGVIGEAVGEGEIGMYAVACVYRNRLKKGMSLGCIALNRKDLDKFVKQQGTKWQKTAKKVIYKVFIYKGKDITGGATHYENVKAFGIPWWSKDMKITCIIGNHTFYREKEFGD